MHSWVEIDASALRANLQTFRALVGGDRVAPVVKSEAYGHGLAPVVTALAADPPQTYCVNSISEGERLRALGFAGRVIVLGPTICREELVAAVAADLEVAIAGDEALARWKELPSPPRMHLKVDTGLSRQGFLPERAREVLAEVGARPGALAGVFSHFADVEDATRDGHPQRQLSRFAEVCAGLPSGPGVPNRHIAASASTLLMPESHHSLCRVGVSSYGLWPSEKTRLSAHARHGSAVALRPALAWRAPIAAVRRIPAGESVSYGCTFRAPHELTAGVVSAGYGDGYPRLAGEHRAFVLVKGRRCAILGRVAMNMIVVDLTGVPEPVAGMSATLIGRDGDEEVPAERLAGWAGTIHYEVVTQIAAAVPRRLIESPKTASARGP